MPLQLTVIDAMWRVAEYTERLAAMETIASAMVERATEREMRSALFLFLAHVAAGRERFAVANRYVDSLSAYAPHHAAAVSSMIALHPALPAAERDAAIASTRRRFAARRGVPTTGKVYVSIVNDDDIRPYDRVEEALLALAAGDSSIARAELRRQIPYATPRARLELLTAATPAERANALRSAAAIDSLYGNSYAPQTPLAPRAVFQLAYADVLAAAGRTAGAHSRLLTVPEDFGFNVAYLAEVHRRRAALLSAMGNETAAAAERARAAQIAPES